MTIRSRPSNDDYRDGWERVFGGRMQSVSERIQSEYTECPRCEKRWLHPTIPEGHAEVCRGRLLLNPHDATEHPAAD